MKLILIEGTKEEEKQKNYFRFDVAFIESLRKPGKTAFIRFTNEMPGGGIILTPNISSYNPTYTHTPAAIYGYPLHNEVILDKLRKQELQFGNLPIIIVYWIDDNKIVNLNKLTFDEVKDLYEQILKIKGREAVTEAFNKWYEQDKKDDSRLDYSTLDFSIPRQILEKNLSIDDIRESSKRDPGKIFWSLIRYMGTSLQKTTLLMRLTLKQKDEEGKIVEKKFHTILDEKSTIDTADPVTRVSQAPIQALSLTSSGIGAGNYKTFYNPSASVQRRYRGRDQKKPNLEIIKEKNFMLFEKHKSVYLSQMRGVRNTLTNKAILTQTPTGYKVTLKMPVPLSKQKYNSMVKKITEAKQKHKESSAVTEQQISDEIAYRVVGYWLKQKNGAVSSARIRFDTDLYSNKSMITTKEGDFFEFNINLASEDDIISASSVYAFLYYLHEIYNATNPDDPKKVDKYNPLYSWEAYERNTTTKLENL